MDAQIGRQISYPRCNPRTGHSAEVQLDISRVSRFFLSNLISALLVMVYLKRIPYMHTSAVESNRLVTIAREEGVRALWKGFVPKVLRLAPGGGVLLLVVEVVSEGFRKCECGSLQRTNKVLTPSSPQCWVPRTSKPHQSLLMVHSSCVPVLYLWLDVSGACFLLPRRLDISVVPFAGKELIPSKHDWISELHSY
jgi:hypothetical protein